MHFNHMLLLLLLILQPEALIFQAFKFIATGGV
jgi:hypothetical protein